MSNFLKENFCLQQVIIFFFVTLASRTLHSTGYAEPSVLCIRLVQIITTNHLLSSASLEGQEQDLEAQALPRGYVTSRKVIVCLKRPVYLLPTPTPYLHSRSILSSIKVGRSIFSPLGGTTGGMPNHFLWIGGFDSSLTNLCSFNRQKCRFFKSKKWDTLIWTLVVTL